MERKSYFLNPGYIFYSEEHYIVETILGSCISVCLWDSRKCVGGINHFIFPDGNGIKEKNCRFGNHSTEYLVKMMLQNGSRRGDLKAVIVGGANHREIKFDVGEKNKNTAKEILNKFGITISEEITGGYAGRKIKFDTYTGAVDIIILREQGIKE